MNIYWAKIIKQTELYTQTQTHTHPFIHPEWDQPLDFRLLLMLFFVLLLRRKWVAEKEGASESRGQKSVKPKRIDCKFSR